MSEMSTTVPAIEDANFPPPELASQEDAAITALTVDEVERNHQQQQDPHRSTAISYECGSDMYLTALLEAIESAAAAAAAEEESPAEGAQVHRAGGGGDAAAATAAATLAVTVLHNIQDRFVEKHVQNGTLTPKSIRFASSATSSTRALRHGGTTRTTAPRRGRRRPPPRNGLLNNVGEDAVGANSTNEERRHTVLSFNRIEL